MLILQKFLVEGEKMNCENCNSELKSSVFSNNRILAVDIVNLINNELNLNSKTYCNFCGDKLHKEALSKLNKRLEKTFSNSEPIIYELKNKLSKINCQK